MSTILGNGSVTFGDGTTLTSGNIPWSSLSGVKTKLSQFINDLPIPTNSISTSGVITTPSNYCTSWAGNYYNLSYNATNHTLQLIDANCNCNCNC